MIKKVISALMSVVLIFSLFSFAAYAKSETVATVRDAAKKCMGEQLITISKATLYTDNKSVGTVYAVFLKGSDLRWDENDVCGIQTCIKSGCAMDNLYLDALIAAAQKSIPKDSKIVLIGHSLGGMIAQQFAADADMKAKYEIIHTMTMGSPYIITSEEREGGINRMADSGDPVPYLSNALFLNFTAGNLTRVDNGYFGKPAQAHIISYRTSESWQKYDCFGIENGTNKLVLS